MPSLIETVRDGAVARVWLNRPEQHNALSPELGSELAAELHDLAHDERVRVVVLGGRGASFCAGADIGAMKASAHLSFEENMAEAEKLARMFAAMGDFPKPVVGRIHGNVFGGGIGLTCACDIAVAAEDARFGITEVRLGILPAVIGPFVTAKIGASAARALFLTGGRFPAPQAHRLGLVHEVVPAGELDAVVDVVVRDLLLGAPSAQRRVKALLRAIVNRPAADVTPLTSAALADQRVSADGQEGLAAFLEKRRAQWVVEP